MSAKKHCDCGRKIVIRRRRGTRFGVPHDHDRIFCSKCWKAEQDRTRVVPERMQRSEEMEIDDDCLPPIARRLDAAQMTAAA